MRPNTHIFTVAVLLICGNFLAFIRATKRSRPPSGIQILDGLCMPRRTDRLVYRHKNETHVYIAFDHYRQGSVTVYSWEIMKVQSGTFISPMTEQMVLAVDFRDGVSRDHILGATSKRHHKTFKTRLNRKMKKCEDLVKDKQKRCKLTSIMSLFVRLKVRNISFNTSDCDKSGFWEKADGGKRKKNRKRKGRKKDGGNVDVGDNGGDVTVAGKAGLSGNSNVGEDGGTTDDNKKRRRRKKNKGDKKQRRNRKKDGRKRRKKQN